MQCLSLRVPASYPDEGFDDPQLPQAHTKALTAWRRQTTDYLHNKAFKALYDFTGNIQIIEAEKDEFVPHQAVQNYADSVADKNRLTHVLMRGAPHQLLNSDLSTEYVKLLSSWAKQQ